MNQSINLTSVLIISNKNNLADNFKQLLLSKSIKSSQITCLNSIRTYIHNPNNKIKLCIIIGNNALGQYTQFKKYFPNIPIIGVIEHHNEIITQQLLRIGAVAVLPLTLANKYTVNQLVMSIFEQAKITNELHKNLELIAHKTRINHEKEKLSNTCSWNYDITQNTLKFTDSFSFIFNQSNRNVTTIEHYITLVEQKSKQSIRNFFQVIRSGEKTELFHNIIVKNKIIPVVLSGKLVKNNENKIIGFGVLRKLEKSNPLLKEQLIKDVNFKIKNTLNALSSSIYTLENSDKTESKNEVSKTISQSVKELIELSNNLSSINKLKSNKVSKSKKIHFTGEKFGVFIEKYINYQENYSSKVNFLWETNKEDTFSINSSNILTLYQQLIEIMIKDSIFHPTLKTIINSHKDNKQFELQILGEKLDALTFHQLKNDLIGSNLSSNKNLNKIRNFFEAELNLVNKKELKLTITFDIEKSKLHKNNLFQKKEINILLVEDHLLNQISIKKLLSTWNTNANVFIAKNGQEALSFLKEKTIDLILMDLYMPVMNGFESAKVILEKYNFPIIACTASEDIEEKKRCENIGFSAYIQKPFNPHILFSAIETHLHQILQKAV